jgi:hypothetical protein
MSSADRELHQGGYIALLSVTIVGAAAMAIALLLLSAGTDAQRTNLVTQQTIQARQLAYGCAEEALQIVHDSTSYTGSGSVVMSTGTCNYTVASTGSSTRTIAVSSTISGVVRRAMIYVTINSSSLSITSWQDVS